MGYEFLVVVKEYWEKEFLGDIVGYIRLFIYFGYYKGIIVWFVE